MIQNHGENAVKWFNEPALSNRMRFDSCLTEIAAIIRLEQLKQADKYVGRWERLADNLTEGMSDLAG
jgi:dTDP-4-amino-4,6-dideoxygalactose transaminase